MAANDDPEYLLGQYNREVERLRKQHAWIQTCLKGRIVFAPVDLSKPHLKVLDVGCADGTLLRDLQRQVSSSAELVGSDIMGSFLPKSPQGNVRFVQADVCEPPGEGMASAFDLTHVRYVLAGAGRVGLETAIANLSNTLAPGGWLQIQEMDVDPERPGVGPAWRDVNSILDGIFASTGMPENFATRMDGCMKKAGLVNVSVTPISLPMGKALEKEEDRRNSLEPFKITIPVLVQAAKDMKLNLPESTFDSLAERFEKEALEEGVTFRTLVVVGQKPQ